MMTNNYNNYNYFLKGVSANFHDNPQFKKFQELSVQAFNVLREHAWHLESIFSLMVSAGMPELEALDDLQYNYFPKHA
jgi:hypothetical protein